jgi:hypothetical protein
VLRSLTLVLLAAVTGLPSAEPAPLHGTPLAPDTGLRLLVADEPPFVLDVDSGRVTRVRGVPPSGLGVVWVAGVAGRAGLVVVDSWPNAAIYALGPGGRLASLGDGATVTPAADGRSAWIKRVVTRSRCTLRQVALDGRTLRAPRAFPCSWRPERQAAGPLGLVVNRTRVIDPLTGRTVYRARAGILVAAGKRLVLAGPSGALTVVDTATGSERTFARPSTLAGLDEPAVSPRGRLVALAFADPAYGGGPLQALDVWLLDTVAGTLTQVPGMPAAVSLKRTSMAWTRDGRLVLFGESGRRNVVAVWRPGDSTLAVRPVRFPERNGSSDSFAVLSRP